MLKFYLLLITAIPLTQAVRLFLTNNDGWDDSNVRSLFDALDATTDHELILCAPEFGTSPRPRPNDGGREVPEDEGLMSDDGESSSDDGESSSGETIFDNAPLPKDPRLNHVRPPLGPEQAIDYGVRMLVPKLYQERESDPPRDKQFMRPGIFPDLFLAGPKIGSSLGRDVRSDAAMSAVQQYARWTRRPSISFAGATGHHSRSGGPWSKIYAQLAKHITQTVIKSGAPYLPKDTYLHVNFPHIDVRNNRCTDLGQFKFVLTSELPEDPNSLNDRHSGEWNFPFEGDVINRVGCYVSMSLGRPIDEFALGRTGLESARREIIQRLRPILSRVPDM